jgi:hypothetical protein
MERVDLELKQALFHRNQGKPRIHHHTQSREAPGDRWRILRRAGGGVRAVDELLTVRARHRKVRREADMSQYYLNQRRGEAYIRDLEGAEFDSLDQAREEAIAAARELISEMALTGFVDLTASFEIVRGEELSARVLFSEAVVVRTKA